ncbi:MMPL/RND family transporter [Mycobacteroides abscessus]|uniref:MMPL/RND family transporter n=2 Tax=Mycobacteroides abscessus TaxID=36809 RepID=UPI0009D3E0FE|nr:RND family transporter [Mycobacteroides abscessus]SKG45667.1 Putative membrane protein, MmpL [Mycobacteroides abscessus subsp. massiliense]SKH55973.1 Putative membrane protein, MmpL [Mycobacteroides abscessus subsp. massiliense]SKH95414.1 Putative membrane protein, MmpL [Mycobacteroides abscessus subsp. massiliense]SKI89312.1 Putative membrane protein, MmpL [Mycobacteroides abscessus subsp. massiliense]SKJ49429.1 Putative membrane protein, MmpL [Mycobacteroides abscessus subsp. massiliense]
MRFVRRFAVPVLITWLFMTVAVNVLVPPIESVAREHAVTMSPHDAPAMIAAKHIGQKYHESDSDSMAMIVLESDDPLGEGAHQYYDNLVLALQADTRHVQHVQNVWGDPLTASGVQSRDGRAAYVQVNLAGDQGSTLGNKSVVAVREIVDNSTPPQGVTVYVTGPAALTTDMNEAADKSMLIMMGVTGAVIMIMLLITYRSVSTMLLVLVMVGFEMGTARGIVAILGNYDLLGFSTFVVAMLSSLAIAAGTDYAIFLIGRYQEARQAGQDRENAYYTMFRGTFHIILGSGLTIAGATLCLHLARLSYFKALGIPSALGLLVVVVGALTAAPAVVVVAGRFGLLDPKRPVKVRRWRRIGTATVRWPGAVFAASSAIALVGIAIMPTMKVSYNDRFYIPEDLPSNIGYTAAERHFSSATMNPDILMIESDHDMRNTGDMIILDRIAKEVFRSPGIAMVQSITRPLGGPIEHTSIPFQISAQSIPIQQNLQFMKDRAADMLSMSKDLDALIGAMERMQSLLGQTSSATHRMSANMTDAKTTLEEIRDHLADFDDVVRPLRNYFYWEQHCFDLPACSAIRSVFDALDGVDAFSDKMRALTTDIGNVDAVIPQMAAQLPPIIAVARSMQDTLLTMHSSFSNLITQMAHMTDTASAMGQAFDASRSGDYFYLPPEAFQNPDFQRGLKLFLSPDGTAARFIITHDRDPATPAGISTVTSELEAAHQAVKGTALTDAKFYLAGTAAIYRDIQSGARYDLLIVGIAAVTLIFAVMMIITRAFVASLAIVGTVLLSLGAAFGISVLVWQHVFGLELNWIAPVFGLIILLAVGSDYNLLLVSRFQEEIGAGLKTGIIRSMGGTGGVVTSAGLVFAFTMMSMVASDLSSIGQAGSTIGLGLLFDTLIVRSLMTPSLAGLLGPWFWWPLRVRTGPTAEARPNGPRPYTQEGILNIATGPER